MNWRIAHRVLRARKPRGRLLLHLGVAAAVLTTAISGAQPAYAGTTGLTNPGCSPLLNTDGFSPGCLPPDLLTLSGLYAATSSEADSLQDLETQAVANTIADHGLASTDGDAVLSWGRSDAEAELFALIEQAISTPATSRTTDQQNAADWVQGVEQAGTGLASQDAGLEYVKWAGLDQSTYMSDIANNATESDLQSFLSGAPEPYTDGGSANNPSASVDGGYCVYQSPAPYQSDYTGNVYTSIDKSTAPASCFGSGGGIGGLLGGSPAPPTIDQFTKWGEADADASLQSSTQAVQAGAEIAAGLDFGAAFVGAGVSSATLSSGLASALVGSYVPTAIFPYAAEAGYAGASEIAEAAADAAAEAAAAAEIASAAGSVVSVVIFAITAIVISSINYAAATALPGKLATAIVDARTTTSDPATLLSGTNGASDLFSLFVGATLPTPTDQTCDNSVGIPPGVTVTGFTFAPGSFPACLNPTVIPPAASTDPQFVVQAKGGVQSSTTSSITWKDTAVGADLTARLSGNWFVVQADGSTAAAQTLSIPYTDWNGDSQLAWLVGSPATGYQFVGYDATAGASTALNPSTCISDGTCWTSPSIDYVGSDGNDYQAEVQAPGTGNVLGTVSGDNPTGVPLFGDAVEGSPVEFFANTFGPLSAFGADGQLDGNMTYTWQFQQTVCNLGCLQVNVGGPDYTTPIKSTGVTYYTFPTSGTYAAQLTATDLDNGDQAVDDFSVQVAAVPPTLALNPDCPANQCDARTAQLGAPMSLAGMITHAGTQDIENVYVDWGDGSGVDSGECGLVAFPGSGECSTGVVAIPNQIDLKSAGGLTLTPDASNTEVALSDTHTYASAGTYYATVTLTDQAGATASRTVVETVTNPAPTMNNLTSTSALIGSSPTVTVNGSGFVPGSTVDWDGTPITSTYVSPTSLTAEVPATDAASATAGIITVVNAGPGGGTTSPQAFYILPAQSSVAAGTLATSTSVSGIAAASVGGSGAGTAGNLSAAASGVGTVAVAQYTADPEPTTPPTAVNAYFDVSVPAASSFTSVQVTDCHLAGGSVVYYYDDTTNQWAEVSGQTYNASTGCVTFTLGTASTPSLAQLSSVTFGVQDVPPSLTVPSDQSVTYHAALSLSVSASDPQPNALSLSATGLPAGLSFTDNGNGTGTVTGTVTGAPGAYPVTFTTGDGVVSTTSPPMTINVTKASTTLAYSGASLIANNRPATLSAVLEEDGGSPPVPDGQTVTLTLGSGTNAQSCQGQATSDGWVSCQIATVNQPLGNQPVSAAFDGDSYYTASSDSGQQSLVFSSTWFPVSRTLPLHNRRHSADQTDLVDLETHVALQQPHAVLDTRLAGPMIRCR